MINHFRTLLSNGAGPVFPGGTPGAAYVPPFTPLLLPNSLEAIRSRLFGPNPDVFFKNYRVRQLLAVVHAGPLDAYVRALDTRITYATTAPDLLDESLYVPVVHPLSGTAADVLTVAGTPAAPDPTGQAYRSYRIAPTGSGTVQVTLQQSPGSNLVLNFTPGDVLPLTGSGYTFKLTTDNPGAAWLVEIINRPQWDLGELVAGLGSLGEPTLLKLFGVPRVEPYTTFANLWETQHETPLRLAALVTALVYRTEEWRVTRA